MFCSNRAQWMMLIKLRFSKTAAITVIILFNIWTKDHSFTSPYTSTNIPVHYIIHNVFIVALHIYDCERCMPTPLTLPSQVVSMKTQETQQPASHLVFCASAMENCKMNKKTLRGNTLSFAFSLLLFSFKITVQFIPPAGCTKLVRLPSFWSII